MIYNVTLEPDLLFGRMDKATSIKLFIPNTQRNLWLDIIVKGRVAVRVVNVRIKASSVTDAGRFELQDNIRFIHNVRQDTQARTYRRQCTNPQVTTYLEPAVASAEISA
jgi:hypothetical protein